jgi:hypothetical protein
MGPCQSPPGQCLVTCQGNHELSVQ